MLNKSKKIIFSLVLITLVSTALSAASKKPKKEGDKISAPARDEVMFIGRITVHNNEDLDFYIKTRGLDDSILEKKDVYYLPYIPTKKEVDSFEIGIFESQAHFKNGDMFFANYTATKTGNFCFTFPIQYFFHGDPNLLIYLPSDFMVSVPKGEKYVYIGDFEFFVEGHDFGVVKVNHTDNYDGAKEEVRRLFGDKAVLSRAELLPVDTEDESYIENLTVVTYYYY